MDGQDQGPDMGGLLGISGIICIILAVFLIYRLLKKRSRTKGDADKLELRTQELKDLIKSTRADFYKRKIEGDRADKLIREYEEELKLATKQIGELRVRYGKAEEKFNLLKPVNIASLLGAVALVVLGLLLLSMSDSSSGGFSEEGKGFSDGSPGDCGAIENSEERDRCYQNLANGLANDDPAEATEYCELIEDTQIGEECYSNLAKAIIDSNTSAAVEICRLVEDEDKRRDCYYNIILNDEKAIKANPELALEVCLNISDDDCLYSIARAVKRESPYLAANACASIESADRRDSCIVDEIVGSLSNATIALEICYNASESRRYECIRRVCERQVNASAQFIVESCCARLDGNNAFECYKTAATNAAGDDTDFALAACQSATSLGPAYKNRARECYEALMAGLGNINKAIAVCKKVPDPANCNDAIWNVFSPTLEMCKSITSKDMREDCLERLVWNAGSCDDIVEICEAAEYPESCYQQGLFNRNSMTESCPQKAIEICLEEFRNVDNCLWGVANALKYSNPNMAKNACNEMLDENQQRNCRDNI